MATSHTSTSRHPVPYATVFDVVVRSIQHHGAKVTGADPAVGFVMASKRMGLATWGEDLTAQVWAEGPGTTVVSLTSKLKFGLVDWGKNKRNVAAIEGLIARALGPGAGSAAAPPPPPPAPPPP